MTVADTKISALTADTTPSDDDLVVTVNDPGGTPANRKVTVANLAAKINENAFTVTGTAGTTKYVGYDGSDPAWTAIPETIIIACSDESTAITTGTAKATFRMPFAMTVSSVRATLSTASSSGAVTVDVNDGGTSIFSTTLTIDASEKTSTTAATAAVLSDTALADDAEITIDIDGAGTGAKGLKVALIGTRA